MDLMLLRPASKAASTSSASMSSAAVATAAPPDAPHARDKSMSRTLPSFFHGVNRVNTTATASTSRGAPAVKSAPPPAAAARSSALERLVDEMTTWQRPLTSRATACATVAELRESLTRLGCGAHSSRSRKADLVADLVRVALAIAAERDDPIEIGADVDVRRSVPASPALPVPRAPRLSLARSDYDDNNAAAAGDDDDGTLPLGASQDELVDVVSEKLDALQLAWDGAQRPDDSLKERLPLSTSQFHTLLNEHVLQAAAPVASSPDEPTVRLDIPAAQPMSTPTLDDTEPTVPLHLTPATPDAALLRRTAACLTPYQDGDNVVRVPSGALGVVLPPAAAASGEDDEPPAFNDSPTVLLTDAARARLRDEQSRGTSSGTVLLQAKPSITSRIVVVADTSMAGVAPGEHDAKPVSRMFPDLRADEAGVSSMSSPDRPTDFQSGRRVLLLNGGAGAPPAAALSSALGRDAAKPFVAPRRAPVVFPTPADESRHSSAAVAPAATVWKARHATAAPLATSAAPPTSSSSPDEPTVQLRLSDRDLLLRTAADATGAQRALLFASNSSRTLSSLSAKSDDMCKPIPAAHGTDSSDDRSDDEATEDSDESDDDDEQQFFLQQQQLQEFASASSSPATPLRRRARRRLRSPRYRHASRRNLPPSPLRRSLTADAAADAFEPKPAASLPAAPAIMYFSGDWRALRDRDGRMIYLHLPTGVVQFTPPPADKSNSSNSSKKASSTSTLSKRRAF